MYRNATAALWDQSALGQQFVELDPGDPSAGPLGDAPIPLAQTESAQDIAQLLDVFDPPTRTALRDTLRAVGGGAAGQGEGLHAAVAAAAGLLSDLGTVSAALATPDAELAAFLRTTDGLATHVAGRAEELRALLRQSEQTLAAVHVDQGAPLGATLDAAPGTLRDARGVLDALHDPLPDARQAVQTLRPGVQALGDSTADLRGVLREAVPPLDVVPRVADRADPAVRDLTRTFADARPFVPRLADGLSSAAPPLRVLAPYVADLALFSDDFAKLISNHEGFRHQLRIFIGLPGGSSLSGLGPVTKEPVNPYPAPGEAIADRDPNGALVPGRGPR